MWRRPGQTDTNEYNPSSTSEDFPPAERSGSTMQKQSHNTSNSMNKTRNHISHAFGALSLGSANLNPTLAANTTILESSVDHSAPDSIHSEQRGKSLLGKIKKSIPQKAEVIEVVHLGRDHVVTLGQEFGVKKGHTLCAGCESIPFSECLPTFGPRSASISSRTDDTDLVFCKPMEKILAQRDWCKFCKMLFRSVCQPEHDLLKPPHIQDYIQPKFKGKTFSEWADQAHFIKRTLLSEDTWPFGHSRDQKETAEAAAENISRQWDEEEEEVTRSSLNDVAIYQTGNLLPQATQASSLGLGVTNIVLQDSSKLNTTEKQVLQGAELATSQLSILSAARSRRLTCWFVVRAYRTGHTKAGVLTVKVFGHGRSPRAPLKRMCAFNLRLERSEDIRYDQNQIRYGRRIGPRIDIEFFTKCLKACETRHEGDCHQTGWSQNSSTARAGNFRLIDTIDMKIVGGDMKDNYPKRKGFPYVALTYCWGDEDQTRLKLTSRNKAQLGEPGALETKSKNIPTTIRDAMRVVERMSQESRSRYLWVDRLCIMQDDINDKAEILPQMDRIYNEALFTIVAADGKDMDAGLSGVSADREVKRNNEVVKVEQVIETVHPGIELFLPVQKDRIMIPWEKRAWTMQEKLLSRRMLIFSNGFAIWRCRHGEWDEDVNAQDIINNVPLPWLNLEPVPFSEDYTRKLEDEGTRLFRPDAFNKYSNVVSQYTTRSLSNFGDIISAFEGLEKVFESEYLLNTQFKFAMPKRFLDMALLWEPLGHVSRRRQMKDVPGPYSKWDKSFICPPSWSWAGWEGVEIEEHEGPGALSRIQRQLRSSVGPRVCLPITFDVLTDETGALRKRISGDSKAMEERIRPLYTWYAKSPKGMTELKGLFTGAVPEDWEFKRKAPVPPRMTTIDDRHIICQTEIAWVTFGDACKRVRHYWSERSGMGFDTYCQETLESFNISGGFSTDIREKEAKNGLQLNSQDKKTSSGRLAGQIVEESNERFLVDKSSNSNVGLVKLHEGSVVPPSGRMEAIALSEAQYFGTETRVDVAGYPLYNIMIIERDTDTGIAERVGLGTIYKYAWRNANRSMTGTVILG